MIKQIIFIAGLPGSGKTTYAVKKYGSRKQTHIIHLDNFLDSKDIGSVIKEEILEYSKQNKFVIEGLLTTALIAEIINATQAIAKNIICYQIFQFRIQHETCLENDKLRMASGARELGSIGMIRNFDAMISISKLIEQFPENNIYLKELDCFNYKENDMRRKKIRTNLELNEDLVFVPSSFDAFKFIEKDVVFAKSKYGGDGEHLYKNAIELQRTGNFAWFCKSDSWSGGGEHGNCWNDEMSYDSPDAPLDKDDWFVEVLTAFVSDVNKISFIQFMKLKKLIETNRHYQTEYYGGHSISFDYSVDCTRLVRELSEMELLAE